MEQKILSTKGDNSRKIYLPSPIRVLGANQALMGEPLAEKRREDSIANTTLSPKELAKILGIGKVPHFTIKELDSSFKSGYKVKAIQIPVQTVLEYLAQNIKLRPIDKDGKTSDQLEQIKRALSTLAIEEGLISETKSGISKPYALENESELTVFLIKVSSEDTASPNRRYLRSEIDEFKSVLFSSIPTTPESANAKAPGKPDGEKRLDAHEREHAEKQAALRKSGTEAQPTTREELDELFAKLTPDLVPPSRFLDSDERICIILSNTKAVLAQAPKLKELVLSEFDKLLESLNAESKSLFRLEAGSFSKKKFKHGLSEHGIAKSFGKGELDKLESDKLEISISNLDGNDFTIKHAEDGAREVILILKGDKLTRSRNSVIDRYRARILKFD